MVDKPTVCFVSRKWPPAVGGIETYSIRLSQTLARHADLTLMVLPGRKNGAVPRPAALIRFGITTFFRLLFQRTPAQITHVTDMASWPLALAARLRNPRGRIVLSAHGTDVSYPLRGGVKGGAYGLYLRLGARLLGNARVLANSTATANTAARFGFAQPNVIRLATDLRPTATTTPGKTLLYSGRLIRLKGCAWFIRNVLPRLPEQVTLDVVGTVWDQAEKDALQADRVTYRGHLDQQMLADAYASALCVVLPNIDTGTGEFEGFGLVAAEAAACGGVVLAAAQGGLTESVIDGETGYLLAPGDADAWVAAIENLLAWTIKDRDTFTKTASETAIRIFSWDRVATETFAAYVDAQKTITAGTQ